MADDDLWVRRFHPAPSSLIRLVVLPHAGGSASFFHPLSAMLSPAVDVLTIQYPGRQDRRREPVIPSIARFADEIFTALRPWTDRPMALFGHSMGAVVAFELGVRFATLPADPLVHLFASGRRAPSSVRPDEAVHLRDDDGLLAEMRRLSGTEPRVLGDPDMLPFILPAVRADYRAVETYRCRPGAAITCPVTVLTGTGDPLTTLDEAEAWRRHTSGDFSLRAFSGGHFFLVDHASEVARLIGDTLAGHLVAERA